MINSEPLFGVKFAVDSFANAAFKTSWLLGVAVSEGEDTARAMARDLDVFRKHYRWVDDDALGILYSFTPASMSSTDSSEKKF